MEYNSNISTFNITFNSTQDADNYSYLIAFSVLRLIVTNTLVVATISASFKQWRYSMGTLMLTLALCDTLLNTILFFRSISYLVLFSRWFNKGLSYLELSLDYWSKLLMLAFSLNRYALVCKPFTHHRITSRKSTVIQLITLAVIALAVHIPGFFYWRMTHRIYIICELISLIVIYGIPFIVTFVLTVLVICELNRNRETLGTTSESTETRQGERNITRAMLITLMAYIILVLPHMTYLIFSRLFKFELGLPLGLTFFILFCLNFSINIFIYTFYLPKFRSTLFGIFKCKCCKKVPDESVRIPTGISSSVQMRQLLP